MKPKQKRIVPDDHSKSEPVSRGPRLPRPVEERTTGSHAHSQSEGVSRPPRRVKIGDLVLVEGEGLGEVIASKHGWTVKLNSVPYISVVMTDDRGLIKSDDHHGGRGRS